jgi:outer membrane protein TolC
MDPAVPAPSLLLRRAMPLRIARCAPLGLVLSATAALAQAPVTPRTLSLEEALRELDAKNLSLAQARGRVEEAAGLFRQALAPALPTITAAGSYTRNSDEATAPVGRLLSALNPAGAPVPDLVIQPREVLAASGTARIPLVVPSTWADAAAARSAQRAAAASAEAVRLDLRAALVQAAWAASASEDVVGASERAVASAEEQARSAEAALEAGTGVPLSVLQARTEAVKRRSDLARARADLGRAQLALGVLLGRAEPLRIPLGAPAAPPALDAHAVAEEALGRRPEVRAQAAEVESAERQLTSARLRHLPQLSASASAFRQDAPLPTGKEDGWRVTVDLTASLYDGGARYGRARQARGALARARAALEAERVAVRQEVEDAARDVGVAAERLHLAQDQVKLASEAAATARRSFAGGVASSLDVLDANDRLYQSEVGLAEARARLGGALAALDRAAGMG